MARSAALLEERGATLMEVLVAMAASIVVVVALVSLLSASLRVDHSMSDLAQADNAGRTAMEEILEELHSTCTGFTVKARGIQAPSGTPVAPLEATGATSLWFVSTFGTKAPEEALPSASLHDIVWEKTGNSSTGQPVGKLVDYTFASAYPSGGKEPSFTEKPNKLEAKAATRTVLAREVTPPLVGSVRKIFQYYRYKTNPENGELESNPMTPPFTSGEEGETGESAHEVAKVSIAFEQLSEDANGGVGQVAQFSDSVALRFGPTEAPVGRTDTPCA